MSCYLLFLSRYSEFVVLRTAAYVNRYEDALEALARGGSRQVAIGLTAEEIRWHPESPGRRMATVVGE
jgi:hypothetical protein